MCLSADVNICVMLLIHMELHFFLNNFNAIVIIYYNVIYLFSNQNENAVSAKPFFKKNKMNLRRAKLHMREHIFIITVFYVYFLSVVLSINLSK